MKLHRRNSLFALAALILTAAFSIFLSSRGSDNSVIANIESIPYALSSFQGTDAVEMDIKSRNILRLTKYIQRDYISRDKESLNLYVGYWQEQSGDYQSAKHSPALCLPSNGWVTEALPKETFPLPALNSQATNLVVKRIYAETKTGVPYAFYYWFFCGKETYNEEWQALLRISLERLFHSRSDGGIVEISIPLRRGLAKGEALKESDEIARKFILEFVPELNKRIY